MKQTNDSNRMGTMPVSKLMLSMGIPIILSMMMQALYNIVDSAFVSNMPGIGEAALNALTLAFPVQMLMVAIAIGTGVGMNALISRDLGMGKKEHAGQVAGNAIFLGLVMTAAYVCFGLFGARAYAATQTANPQILQMTVDYLHICCIVCPGIVFFAIFEKLLQASGRSNLSTIAQITGALVNIVLDPIMIYGLFGFPALQIRGAAWATVAGQLASFLLAAASHVKKNTEIRIRPAWLRPDGQILKGIYSIGLPAIIAQALMSVMTYGLNVILIGISESAVTAYGLYYKIWQFLLFAAFGLRDAITPIVSYNYGRGDRQRIREGIRYGILYTCVIMAAGMLILELFAAPISRIFGLSGETQQLCILAMHVISLSFLFAGVNVALQGVFQALESGLQSLVISVLRQFLLVLPVAWAAARLAVRDPGKMWLVWATFLFSEGISMAVSLIFMRKIRAARIDRLPEAEVRSAPGTDTLAAESR